jgi:hypothetical protein
LVLRVGAASRKRGERDDDDTFIYVGPDAEYGGSRHASLQTGISPRQRAETGHSDPLSSVERQSLPIVSELCRVRHVGLGRGGQSQTGSGIPAPALMVRQRKVKMAAGDKCGDAKP